MAEEVALAATALAGTVESDEAKAAFLTALARKGETGAEVAAFATAFRAKAIDPGVGAWAAEAIDVVGTGGDHAGGFNISSLVVLVLASAGVKVMKHGNRGITSKCGSADLLAALGVNLEADPAQQQRALAELGFAFFFAPAYHPAFRHIMPVRKALAARGQRTVFNVLGPLLNPGRPAHVLAGVYDPSWVPRLAGALELLGTGAGLVAHGVIDTERGIDELTTATVNRVQGVGRLRAVSGEWRAGTFGLTPSSVCRAAGRRPHGQSRPGRSPPGRQGPGRARGHDRPKRRGGAVDLRPDCAAGRRDRARPRTPARGRRPPKDRRHPGILPVSAARQYFGTDGVRGVYGGPVINEQFAARLGVAAAPMGEKGGSGSVVIGRDTRFSGGALAEALAKGLRAGGLRPTRLGILPTPALAHAAVQTTGAALGAVITASHNPASDNGIKFFRPGGRKLSDEEEARIEALLPDEAPATPRSAVSFADSSDAVDTYISTTRALLPLNALAGWRVVLDTANGATSRTSPRFPQRSARR